MEGWAWYWEPLRQSGGDRKRSIRATSPGPRVIKPQLTRTRHGDRDPVALVREFWGVGQSFGRVCQSGRVSRMLVISMIASKDGGGSSERRRRWCYWESLFCAAIEHKGLGSPDLTEMISPGPVEAVK